MNLCLGMGGVLNLSLWGGSLMSNIDSILQLVVGIIKGFKSDEKLFGGIC